MSCVKFSNRGSLRHQDEKTEKERNIYDAIMTVKNRHVIDVCLLMLGQSHENFFVGVEIF